MAFSQADSETNQIFIIYKNNADYPTAYFNLFDHYKFFFQAAHSTNILQRFKNITVHKCYKMINAVGNVENYYINFLF